MSILILCVFQALFVASVEVYSVQQPTPAESQSAKEIAVLFSARLDETADISRLFRDLYADDFIERYIKQQKNSTKNQGASHTVFFAPGLQYRPQLLEQATPEDWKRFYVATYNFLYYGIVSGMNRSASDLLIGKPASLEMMETLYPPKVVKLLDEHPILNNFIRMKESPRPLGSVEEMRDVTATLEQAIMLMRSGRAENQYQLTGDARKLIEVLKKSELLEASVEVADEEFFGYPSRTRIVYITTPLMIQLAIVKVDDKFRIVWTESGPLITKEKSR